MNLERLKENLRGKKKRKDPNQWLIDAAAVAKKSVNKKIKPDWYIERIYALHIDDYDDLVDCIYIGVTSDTLKARLSKHLSEAQHGTSKKDKTIKKLLMAGCLINIKLLEEYDSRIDGNQDREDYYITQAYNACSGAHNSVLLNSKKGDTDRSKNIIIDIPEKTTPKKTRKSFSQDYEIISEFSDETLYAGSTTEKNLKKYLKTTIENIKGMEEQGDTLDALIRAVNSGEMLDIVKVKS